MRRSFVHRWLGVAVSSAIVLAACSSAATPAPTARPTAAPTTAASAAAPTATPMPGAKAFSVVFTSPGLSSAPMLSALDKMRGAGYTVDIQVIESSELVVQGIFGGQFQFGSGANNAVLQAIEKGGGKMHSLMARVANEWTLYVRKATIKTCADLGGKKVAIHSEGSISTAMLKNYVQTVCPGTTPNYQIIAGSPNRVAALLADVIDATPAELSDTLKIDSEASDRFGLLTSFAKDLPNLQTTGVHVNVAWAKDNPGTVYAVVKAILTEYRRLAGNAAELEAVAKKYVAEQIDLKSLPAAAKKYAELNMFPVNGGNTRQNLQYSADFFKTAGVVTTSIALETWSDLSHLEAVLKELGTK